MSEQSARSAMPPWLTYERIAFLFCFVVAAAFFWQAAGLDMWTIVGPGPGLFPLVTAGFCAVCAALLALFPKLANDRSTAMKGQEIEAESMLPEAGERRAFWAYCVALPILAVGSIYLGFIALSVVVALFLTWWAERRSFFGALAFGLVIGLIGVIGFNYYLNTSIPLVELDQMVLRLVR